MDTQDSALQNFLGILSWSRAKLLEADEFFGKTLALDPNNADALLGIAIRLGIAGRVKEAVAIMEKAHELEPFLPQISVDTARDRWLDGQNDAAIALAQTLRPTDRAPTLALIYASIGRYDEAANALTELASDSNSPAAQAARLLRTAPAKAESPDALPRLPQNLEFTYLHVGAAERAITTYERRADVGFVGGSQLAFVWHSTYAPVRKTERFKALMRKVGLVEYWRAKGWPELCRPLGADDFDCD
jgi:tetratricopeptide (TPR) repeat protein